MYDGTSEITENRVEQVAGWLVLYIINIKFRIGALCTMTASPPPVWPGLEFAQSVCPACRKRRLKGPDCPQMLPTVFFGHVKT